MAITPRALVHNWRLKLSALGLSVFLWALVQTEPQNAETFSAVPLRVEVADTEWTVSGPPSPATVQLRLTGPAREIIRLAREGTMVRIPIREVGSADTVVTLRRDWVAVGEGRGVSVESLNPPTVRISLERAASKVVPLGVRVHGSLPGHLALASPIGLSPQLVRVRGPASRIQNLDSLPLRPLDLSEVSKSGVFEIPVDTMGLHNVRVTPPTATVGIRVEEEVERVLSGVPVIAHIPGDGPELTVGPTTVDVTLRGARTLVTAVDPADLRAWVAPELLEGMTPGEDRRVPVKVEGVPDLVSLSVPDDIVTVHAAGSRAGGSAR